MSFAAVITELKDDLADILPSGIEIPDQPRDAINEWPMLVIYPQPRTWTITARNNGTGELKYQGAHDIVVEWATNYDNLERCVAEATPVADAIPLALFAGFTADKFGGTVHHLNSITCDLYGAVGETPAAFFVRFVVNVEIVETTG